MDLESEVCDLDRMGEIADCFVAEWIENSGSSPPRTAELATCAVQQLSRPRPIQPAWTDFYIGTEPLFEASKAYLEAARSLRKMGFEIEKRIHSGKSLTDPPDTSSNP